MINCHKDVLPLNIPFIEEKYKAKYVGEFCLRNNTGGWVNFPVAIFYTEEKHPKGSNYMGVFFDLQGKPTITDGLAAAQISWNGLYNEDTGEFTYSGFRHDFQQIISDDGVGAFIDGGQDYGKFGGQFDKGTKIQSAMFIIDKDKIVKV